MDELHFQKIGDVPIPSDGYGLVAKSVANDHSLLYLYVEPAGKSAVRETFKQGIGVFPKVKLSVPKRFRLIRASAGLLQTIELSEFDVTFPIVDMFPDGKVLISASRCSWRGKKDYDLNGIIFDPKTGQSSRILLGDGINNVQIDAKGRIWVAYSDEGVYGNFGWGGSGPSPVGAAGLVCFSEAGAKLWEYPSADGETITDCYALNVSSSGATICFYTDFPICRISSNFELEYWRTDLQGCNDLAVFETKALLSGQYGDPLETGYLGILDRGKLTDVTKVRLLLPDGSGIAEGQLLGRGGYLYFFDACSAYRAGLD